MFQIIFLIHTTTELVFLLNKMINILGKKTLLNIKVWSDTKLCFTASISMDTRLCFTVRIRYEHGVVFYSKHQV